MDSDGLGKLEKAALYLNDNHNNKNDENHKLGYLSTKIASLGYRLREKGRISKHTAGALAAFHHAILGKQAQTELEELWEVGPGYFTKWHTTLWYGLSHVYEHAPIFGTSFLVDVVTGINEGNYLAIGNWAAGTVQNLVRFTSAFVFKRPMAVISLIAAPMQIRYYRKEIKSGLVKYVKDPIKKMHKELKQETDYLLRQ